MIIENGVLTKIENSDIKKGLVKSDGIEKVVVLPSKVHTIGKNAFFGAVVDTVVYTKNLKKIEDCAFFNSTIEKMHRDDEIVSKGVVSLKDSVEFIGRESFSKCERILGAKIDSKEIGESAFENCLNLGVVFWGEGVETINNYAFKNTKLKFFKMKNTTNLTLGRGLFSFVKNVEDLKLPEIFYKPYVNPNQNEFGEAKGEVEEGHIFYATKNEWN